MILLTGATGFVGRNLIHKLKENYKIRILLRPDSNAYLLKDINVEKVLGNPFSIESLQNALEGAEYIIHCAGVTMGLNYNDYYKGNVLYTQNLLEAIKKYNPSLKKFIYISSQAASGPCITDFPKKEDDPATPISWYGLSKLIGEKKVKESNVPYIILRPCGIYGPYDHEYYPLFKMTKLGLQIKLGDGLTKVNFLYIDDFIQAIELCLKAKIVNKTYFVTGDGEYSWLNTLNTCKKIIGKKVLRIRIPKFFLLFAGHIKSILNSMLKKPSLFNKDKAKEMVQNFWICDTFMIKKELGYSPKYSLEEGFRLTYEWYKKEKYL